MSDERVVIGYMDKVDWDHELGRAIDGNKVYPSIEALKKHETCTDTCGIVEVEVRLKRIIAESDFSIKPHKMYGVTSIDRETGERKRETITGEELIARQQANFIKPRTLAVTEPD